MNSMLILAWRNIWRNKRRTLITAASIFFAVVLSLLMRSIQIGTFNNIVNNVVRGYSGYIQVHKAGYWDDRDINNSFAEDDTLVGKLEAIRNVSGVAPRLESFALASSGPKTKGILVTGVDPAGEEKLTGLQEKIVAGRYLLHSDSGVLLGQKTAEYLGLHPGDTLVMIGQGYHGVSAAGKWPVLGIVHLKSPQLDRQIVYMPLQQAQEFYSAGSRITSLVVDLKDQTRLNATMKKIRSAGLSSRYEVMSWKDMMVELVQFIQSKSVGSYIVIGILYLVVGFGIFGTTLMMTLERIRELGVMIALGTQKLRLAAMVFLETLFIGATGLISGLLVILPVILYFAGHPVRMGGDTAKTYETYGFESLLCFEAPSSYVMNNILVILVLVLIATIYPLQKIRRLDLVYALHYKV